MSLDSPLRAAGSRSTRPSLTLLLPEAWFFKESYTLLAPDGRANIIASTEPLDPVMTGLEYAQVQSGLLEQEFPGFEPLGPLESLRLEGLEGLAYLRDFSWTPPDGAVVRQVQIYAAVPGRGITATATATKEDFSTYESLLLDLLQSILVDSDAASSMVTAPTDARHDGND